MKQLPRRKTTAALLLASMLGLTACFRSDPDCQAIDSQCDPFTAALLYQLKDSSGTLMATGTLSGTGLIRTTTDGINWTTLASPAGAASLTGIVRSGDRLIAVGGTSSPSCYIATSDDLGRTWTQRSCGSTGVALSGVRAGNGMLVTTGADDGGTPPVRVSYDNGTTWLDPANGPAGGDFNYIEFYNGSFYAASGGATSGLFASTDPFNVAFSQVEPVAGAYFYPRALHGRLYAVNNGPAGLHVYDGSSFSSSSGLFASRPVDETSYSMAVGGERTIVAGGGFSAGSSSCWVDYSTDAVNFQGGGVMDSACSAVAGESYLIFRALYFRGLYLAYGLEAIGGTNKFLSAYSPTGLPGDWTVSIGTAEPFHNDFLLLSGDD